jgi:hypothetical protein
MLDFLDLMMASERGFIVEKKMLFLKRCMMKRIV